MPAIQKDIEKISKNIKLALGALSTYDILLKVKEFKTPEIKLQFLMSIKREVIQLITLEQFNKLQDEALEVLRHFFKFFAEYDELLIEGLKFFSLFTDLIKVQKFNSIKAFVFYFAYQTRRFNSPQVKELLQQELLNVNISEPRIYLEFCMYCFYKGLYYIERKNFFMASYLYGVAVSMGIRGNHEDCKLFNCFSMQMLRSLCFLKSLTDYEIKKYLFKESRSQYGELLLINHEDIKECINYLINEKNDLQSLNNFVKANKEIVNNHKLKGLYNEAEEALILKKIRDILALYKKIKMTKLAQQSQVEFKDLMRVMKKKVMEGEISIKYDEVTDVVEVFDVDPGLKERVKKTKELYSKIIEGNKNIFINLRDRKLDEISGKKYSQEEMDLLAARQIEEQYYDEEEYNIGMDMDD